MNMHGRPVVLQLSKESNILSRGLIRRAIIIMDDRKGTSRPASQLLQRVVLECGSGGLLRWVNQLFFALDTWTGAACCLGYAKGILSFALTCCFVGRNEN
ncbi:hypothetical protein QOT17_020059 [Balamuthia mandrillaris]